MAAIPTASFLAPKSCHDNMIKSGRLSPRASPSSPVVTPPGSPMAERQTSPFAKHSLLNKINFGQILHNQIKHNNMQPTVTTTAGKIPPTVPVNTNTVQDPPEQPRLDRRQSDFSPETVGMSA
ncbi:uncharacterized protein [Amphiura filiformis]|uniref:uncharacterized protein n=1 Tax=Amphiura filiformis TaxID=82378 RepID=UPI003B21FD3F